MENKRSVIRTEHLYLILIVVFGFALHLYILTRYALAYGMDGPYYLVQVRNVLETGALKYDDPPLAIYILALFTLLLGGNMTLGIKVGTAFFSALSAAPLYFWVKGVSGSRLAGYVAAIVSILSSQHILLMNNYLKMVIGSFFLLCFLHYLHRMLTEKGDTLTLFLAVLSLVSVGATHAVVFFVAFLFLILYAIVFRVSRPRPRETIRSIEILLLTAFTIMLILPLILPPFFKDYYHGIDLVLSPFYRFRPPVLFSAGVVSHFILDYMSGAIVLAAIISGIMLLGHELRAKRRKAVLALIPVTFVGILLLLVASLIPIEWVWRFLYMEFITVAFIIGYGFSKIQGRRMLLTIAILLCFSLIILQAVEASKVMMPTISEADYAEIEEMKRYIPPKSIVFANPLYMYWIEYITRADTTFMFSPELWRYEHIFILVDKFYPPPVTPNATIVFEGRRFILYEIELKAP